MTASMARQDDDQTIVLRRRREVRLIEGKPQGVYTKTFEIICLDCGDDPLWDYHDVPPRLQHIRGPYWIEAGAREYEAHIAWHETMAARQVRGESGARTLGSRSLILVTVRS